MKANTYNGWKNRETWLVNLYYSEVLGEYVRENIESFSLDLEQEKNEIIYDISQQIKEYIEELLEEEIENLSSFLKDFLDLSLIEWYELAETLFDDHVQEVLEEMSSDEEEEEEEE